MKFPLTSGCSGVDVGELHQALIEASYSVADDDLRSRSFGSSTTMAVRAFQARAVYQGRPIDADGIVGHETWYCLTHPGEGAYTAPGWSYDAEEARPSVRPVITTAVGELGVHETPPHSNRGVRIDEYTAPDVGIPWCGALCSWAYRKATPPSPFGRILSANGIFQWGRQNNRLIAQAEPVLPGDVFIILRGKDKGGMTHGHCGILVKALDGREVCTIEGNASDAVRGIVRNRATFTAVVRPVPEY